MKNTLTLVILFVTFFWCNKVLYSQLQLPIWIGKKITNSDVGDDVFDRVSKQFVNEVPEKYATESNVILGKQDVYYYGRDQNSNLILGYLFYRKIKLHDKAAVDDYSEFYFSSNVNLGIRILKQDGQKVIVSTDNALEVKTEVPKQYKDLLKYSSSYQKLAVQSLEIGDVIEYYVYSVESHKQSRAERDWPDLLYPRTFLLGGDNPILASETIYFVKNGYKFKYNTYNDAPSIQLIGNATNKKGKKLNDIKVYSLRTDEIPKVKDERWSYMSTLLPKVKIDLNYFYNNGFKGDSKEIKQKVTAYDIAELLWKEAQYEDQVLLYYSNYKELRKKLKNEPDSEKAVNIIFDDSTLMRKGINPHNFIKLLNITGHEAEFLVTTGRQNGSIHDILHKEELERLVYLPKTKKIVGPKNMINTANDIGYRCQGQKAFRIKLEKNKKKSKIEVVTIPYSSYSDNVSHSVSHVVINDFKDVDIKVKNTFSGDFKEDISKTIFLGEGVFYFSNDEKLSAIFSEKYIDSQVLEDQIVEYMDEMKALKLEKLKERVNQNFELINYDSCEVLSYGSYSNEPKLIFKESYSVKDAIQKANNKYLLKVGQFIGKQVTLTKEEVEQRSNDIYLDFAKTITKEVIIKIPNGYMVKGLDKLNTSVENNFGMFESIAKLENNEIVIKTKKVYKKAFVEKENWSYLVDFLEAAYSFTKEKVIFEKK